jgi:hypothetical protein
MATKQKQTKNVRIMDYDRAGYVAYDGTVFYGGPEMLPKDYQPIFSYGEKISPDILEDMKDDIVQPPTLLTQNTNTNVTKRQNSKKVTQTQNTTKRINNNVSNNVKNTATHAISGKNPTFKSGRKIQTKNNVGRTRNNSKMVV